ncbi:hypothetical protein [Lacticaseibacillus brantae]|uniref:Uncharacterized protein n=1 Tax=Lacticaseibacillus brantae DSM 23927 TaxID=1423727 RepID=A0A0R2B0I8_9LACO|nr:hypothetical protein [Lacticaseibacillus brantae]KRM73000.1 hypothetical protein FC34_GL000719 [Lacticaseibacillus brantae DSM 23927]
MTLIYDGAEVKTIAFGGQEFKSLSADSYLIDGQSARRAVKTPKSFADAKTGFIFRMVFYVTDDTVFKGITSMTNSTFTSAKLTDKSYLVTLTVPKSTAGGKIEYVANTNKPINQWFVAHAADIQMFPTAVNFLEALIISIEEY